MSVGNMSARAAAMLGAACWPDREASCASDIRRDSFLGKHTWPLQCAAQIVNMKYVNVSTLKLGTAKQINIQ